MKSPANNSQHGIWTLRLHTTHTFHNVARRTLNIWWRVNLYAGYYFNNWIYCEICPISQSHTCIFSEISLSSQPVSMLLCWKLSVSSNLMRYSTVVLKSPLIDNSFKATTMLLQRHKVTTANDWWPHWQKRGEQQNMHLLLTVTCDLRQELTIWLLRDSPPRRNSVQIVSQQTRVVHQLPRHWSSPTHSYCCGNSAPALFLNLVWNPLSKVGTPLIVMNCTILYSSFDMNVKVSKGPYGVPRLDSRWWFVQQWHDLEGKELLTGPRSRWESLPRAVRHTASWCLWSVEEECP